MQRQQQEEQRSETSSVREICFTLLDRFGSTSPALLPSDWSLCESAPSRPNRTRHCAHCLWCGCLQKGLAEGQPVHLSRISNTLKLNR